MQLLLYQCWWLFNIWLYHYAEFSGQSSSFLTRYRLTFSGARTIRTHFSHRGCFLKGKKCSLLFCFPCCASLVLLFDRAVGNFLFTDNWDEMIQWEPYTRTFVQITISRPEDINLVRFIYKSLICGRWSWIYYSVNEALKPETIIWIDRTYLFRKNGSETQDVNEQWPFSTGTCN